MRKALSIVLGCTIVSLAGCAAGPPPAPAPAPAQAPVPAPAPPDAAPSPAPAAPAPAPASPAGAESSVAAFQRVLAGMGVKYLPEEKRLEVAGWVNMQKGLVEVFACSPGGKTHESVVVLDCVPSGLHAGLLALGLKPGAPVEASTEADYKPPTGDRVEITVTWKGPDGAELSARAEDWVWNQKEERPMERSGWIYAGSFMQAVTGNPRDSTYAANFVKSLVTTYHDSSSIIENPWADGRDDTLYYANEKAVPPPGAPITVSFRAGEKGK